MLSKFTKTTFITIILTIFTLSVYAQYEQVFSSADILHDMRKLQNTGRVLYIAAHPDDENTRFISYMVNGRKFETAYLALTRGDGGQNVIGSELREGLGLIRTQELLAARRIDGGKQFFTRANDFGYSKTPSETFNIWDREAVLSDVVWVIRNFQPDIIVTRFNETPGTTHGHHTASAILAHEAFTAAADKEQFPDQLAFVDAWETKKLYWNTSSWFYRGDKNFDESKYIKLDVGGYDAVLGSSYTEIAARSRSKHKSQAFGSSGSRGSEIELFEQLEGEKSQKDLFDGINTSWDRYSSKGEISKAVKALITTYDAKAPEKSIPKLLALKKQIAALESNANSQQKLELINQLIMKSAGFYHRVATSNSYGSRGDSLSIHLELVNRSKLGIEVLSISGQGFKLEHNNLAQLGDNEQFEVDYKVKIDEQKPLSTPYWLKEDPSLGMYKVSDQKLRGLPENSAALTLKLVLLVEGQELLINSPVVYKTNDRIKGEVIEPFYITPPLTVEFTENVLIYTQQQQEKTVTLQVKALKDQLSGTVQLTVPEGWEFVGRSSYSFNALKLNEIKTYDFILKSGNKFGDFELGVEAILTDKKVIDQNVKEISYDHIPNQVIIEKAKAYLMFADVKTSDRLIGYIAGAGDKIPEALKSMGYTVESIDMTSVALADLMKYQTIVAGIRAYNTNEALQNQYQILFDYMKAGGTYVVQYNTTYSLPDKPFFPFKLGLSRDRITDEMAPFNILSPKHELLNSPNRITNKDFDNWVQERGLYFPSSWGKEISPMLEGNDSGETPTSGALLIADYGEGKFIYTGLSFFRELPAGVSGAYRLFSNLVSY